MTWRNVFLSLDAIAKFWEKHGSGTIRKRAILRAEQWMLERTKYSDGLGAIYPSMQYVIMRSMCSATRRIIPIASRLSANSITDGTDRRRDFFQPCFSPVWDTAIAGYALGEAGLAPQPALNRMADWLLTKEVRRKGDWSIKRPDVEPSGWYFEFANEFYPDIDDTAMVLLSLLHARASNSGAQEACAKRAVNWLLAMQSKDGGWAAFDVDNNWEPLSLYRLRTIMRCSTRHALISRAASSRRSANTGSVRAPRNRARDRLSNPHSGAGRLVVWPLGRELRLRYLSGLAGPEGRRGERPGSIRFAGRRMDPLIQNADGGWGESCESYRSHCLASAPSTPSQTAWAVLGLLAGAIGRASACKRVLNG